MSQQIIAEFESRFIQNFLHQQATLAMNVLELSEDSVEKVINIFLEMGFDQYILTNVYKLEMDDEQYLTYATKMIELFKLQEELEDIVGSTIIANISAAAANKSRLWMNTSMDEFIDRLYD